ncbi:MAG: YicC family protein [Gemmataceae bacterium]|nr:YicC family protein [Gemmataceae bacterium]
MLYSMTGYGEAYCQDENLSIGVELRAVNNRYLKVQLRGPETHQALEPEFEKVIRKAVRRGTIQVHLRLQRKRNTGEFQIQVEALRGYLRQLQDLGQELKLGPKLVENLAGQLLMLPGVIPEDAPVGKLLEEDWPRIEIMLQRALEKFQAMRVTEGQWMASELLALKEGIAGHLERIRGLALQAVEGYRDRLLERVRGLLRESGATINPADLIREVAVFAERADIAEEIVRLGSHLEQFAMALKEVESPGRKLEFLVQEMARETNTMGSKAPDVEISREVVEIKGGLERIRELIQNVE